MPWLSLCATQANQAQLTWHTTELRPLCECFHRRLPRAPPLPPRAGSPAWQCRAAGRGLRAAAGCGRLQGQMSKGWAGWLRCSTQQLRTAALLRACFAGGAAAASCLPKSTPRQWLCVLASSQRSPRVYRKPPAAKRAKKVLPSARRVGGPSQATPCAEPATALPGCSAWAAAMPSPSRPSKTAQPCRSVQETAPSRLI